MNELIKNKFSFYEFSAASAIFLLSFNYLNINALGINSATVPLRVLSVYFLIVCFVRHTKINKRYLLLLSIATFGTALGFGSNFIGLNIAFLIFFVVFTKSFDVESITTYCTLSVLFVLFLSLILLWTHVTENIVYDINGRLRNTFGFNNVNAFSGLVSVSALLILYRARNLIVIQHLLVFIVVYVVYLYTDTRAMVATVLQYLFFYYFFKIIRVPLILKIFSVIYISLPVVAVLFIEVIYNRLPWLDVIFSGRITFAVRYLSSLGSQYLIFGGRSPQLSNCTIDNSFLLMIGSVGLIFLIIFVTMSLRATFCAIDNGEAKLYGLLLSFWFFSFFESSLVRPESTASLVIWSLILRKGLNFHKGIRVPFLCLAKWKSTKSIPLLNRGIREAH